MRPGGTPDRRIEFRVGIHLGDVVEESDGNVMLSRKSAIESCVTSNAGPHGAVRRDLRDSVLRSFPLRLR
jgi:hypothetical protein